MHDCACKTSSRAHKEMCLLHRSACMDQRAHAPMVRLAGLARGPQGAMRGPCPFCLHSVQDLLFPPPFPAGGGRGEPTGEVGGMASPHRNLQRQRGAARRSSARSMYLYGAHEVTGALRTMQCKVTCMHARFEDTRRACPFVTCLVTARIKRASEAQIPLRRLCGDQSAPFHYPRASTGHGSMDRKNASS